MKALARIHATLLRVAIADSVQYRGAGAIWMLGMFIEPLIYLAVWSAVSGHEGAVMGYDARKFAAYYLTFFVINHLTFTWVMEVFQYRIQMGSLSFELLRPMHPIHGDIADNLGFKLVMSALMVPGAALLYVLFSPRFETPAWALLLLPPSIVLAYVARFCFEWSVALSAFWTTRITAVNRTYYTVQQFLSGRVAPLAVLPAGLGAAAQLLPFYGFVGFPVDMAIGSLTFEQALRGLVMQACWAGFGLLLVKLLFRRALRTFTAVGS